MFQQFFQSIKKSHSSASKTSPKSALKGKSGAAKKQSSRVSLDPDLGEIPADYVSKRKCSESSTEISTSTMSSEATLTVRSYDVLSPDNVSALQLGSRTSFRDTKSSSRRGSVQYVNEDQMSENVSVHQLRRRTSFRDTKSSSRRGSIQYGNEDLIPPSMLSLASTAVPIAIQPHSVTLGKSAKRALSVRSKHSLKSVPSLASLNSELWSSSSSESESESDQDQSDVDSEAPVAQSFPELLFSRRVSLKTEQLDTFTSRSMEFQPESSSLNPSRTPATSSRQTQNSLASYRRIQALKMNYESSKATQVLGLQPNARPTTSHHSCRPQFSANELENYLNEFITKERTRSRSNVMTAKEIKQARENANVVETSTIYVKNERQKTLYSPTGLPEATTGKVNQYHILNEIGSGSFGRVHLCRHGKTGQYYACKVISKSRLQKKLRWMSLMPNADGKFDITDKIKREIAVLKKLSRHPNINFMVEVLDDAKEDNIYMIFELCEYGPIMELEMGKTVTPYNETMAQSILRDVLLGLEYLHFKKIIHRDIKPENLLFGSDFSVQIADFGISHAFENEDEPSVEDKNASPVFSPPEALQSGSKIHDGKAADVWSLGVTLYCLVHGHAPFEDENIVTLSQKVINDPYTIVDGISDLLKDLLCQMLQKDPRKRITIPEIKVHPWVTSRGRTPMISTEENCIYEDVTAEELENALSHSVTFVTRFVDIVKRRLSLGGPKSRAASVRHG